MQWREGHVLEGLADIRFTRLWHCFGGRAAQGTLKPPQCGLGQAGAT